MNKKRLRKYLITTGICLVSFFILTLLTFKLTPWPSALFIRYIFNKEGKKVNEQLIKYTPDGIAAINNEQYIDGDADAKLDLYFPSSLSNTQHLLPVIVWVHGGGWIAGSKDQMSSYCKILASKGFCVIAIDYSLAPGTIYPRPVVQSNKALKYINKHSKRFHADTSRFILAGDSGGAHIVAQTANIITAPSYAKLVGVSPGIHNNQLSGLILYCGPYNAEFVDQKGEAGIFLETVLWSYSGKKDYNSVPGFKAASVIHYLTKDFPPSFISAGNGDPLLPHSQALVAKLNSLNVKVDSLFFKKDHSPSLPHEYQFSLDTPEGMLALENSVRFLKLITDKKR
jgi:acetyl esterase